MSNTGSIFIAMRALLLAGCLLAIADAAQAASFDCDKASTAVERAICADPALSRIDERLAEAYRAALVAAFRPATLQRQQASWLAERDKRPESEALLQSYENRLAAIAKLTTLSREARRAVMADQARTSCILPPEADTDASCAVDSFDTVDGDRALRYQLQIYKDGDLRIADGVVVLQSEGDMLQALVATAEDDARLAPPRIVTSPAGKLLFLPGHISGTGNFNAEILFRYDNDHLIELDTWSWQRDLGRRLPEGSAVWKGIYPDYKTFSASTPLWQRSDGNCCPTAGRADIKLGLQGDRFVIRDLIITKGADAAAR